VNGDQSNGNRERFAGQADEKLTAFVKREKITHELALLAPLGDKND